MIVVDASALAPALGDDGEDGDNARSRLHGESLCAPELIDLDVASAIRRQLASGQFDQRRAELALTDLVELPIRRVAHRPLLSRCWELRRSLTIYDAASVALAELHDLVLVTADARLSKAPGVRCKIDLIR